MIEALLVEGLFLVITFWTFWLLLYYWCRLL